jgi:hypothetical protein
MAKQNKNRRDPMCYFECDVCGALNTAPTSDVKIVGHPVCPAECGNEEMTEITYREYKTAEKERNRYVQFEYDLTYTGGDYSGVGQHVYVPFYVIEPHLGDEKLVRHAFREHTYIDPIHIIHYQVDQLYTKDGKMLND